MLDDEFESADRGPARQRADRERRPGVRRLAARLRVRGVHAAARAERPGRLLPLAADAARPRRLRLHRRRDRRRPRHRAPALPARTRLDARRVHHDDGCDRTGRRRGVQDALRAAGEQSVRCWSRPSTSAWPTSASTRSWFGSRPPTRKRSIAWTVGTPTGTLLRGIRDAGLDVPVDRVERQHDLRADERSSPGSCRAS